MDFYKGVFLGPVLVGKGDNSFFLKCDLAGFASGLLKYTYTCFKDYNKAHFDVKSLKIDRVKCEIQ